MHKRLFIITLLLSWVENSWSQNLVPNPSFECGTDMCDADNNPTLFGQWACSWEAATFGTPDIFSTKLNCTTSMPNSIYYFLGSQTPRTGSRFAGVYTYQEGRTHREYMKVKLNEKLVPGERYCASMYVSKATGMKYASNNMAMYFGELSPGSDGQILLPLKPQIETHEVITSTQWYEVRGLFIATSPTDNLVIGNFEDDNNTQVVQKGGINVGNNSINRAAYYFVDDVIVERIPSKIIFSGPTTICENDQTNITISQSWDEAYWTTLQDTLTIVSSEISLKAKPTLTTTYRVKARKCGYFLSDTITIRVKPSPIFDLGRDTTLCTSQSILLDAGSGFATYLWQDFSTIQTYHVSKPGTYSVSVGNNLGCVTRRSIKVYYKTKPAASLGNDSLICGAFYALRPGHADSYEWSTGSSDSVFTPISAGKYWVTLRNQCGSSLDTVQLFSMSDLFVPNVLTVNADAKNENLRFKDIGSNFQATVRIFNRWGNEIFSKKNYHDEWPLSNDLPSSGSYYVVIEFAGCRTFKGWIEVVK